MMTVIGSNLLHSGEMIFQKFFWYKNPVISISKQGCQPNRPEAFFLWHYCVESGKIYLLQAERI